MKIFTNQNYEIKAIDFSEDTSLIEVEVDREEVFGNMSDFMILNYCYKQDKNSYSIYPARNYSDIVEEDYKLKIEDTQRKVAILETENQILREELTQIQSSINLLTTRA